MENSPDRKKKSEIKADSTDTAKDSSLDLKKLQEMLKADAFEDPTFLRLYSGPIPSPQDLKKYDEIVRGSASKIMHEYFESSAEVRRLLTLEQEARINEDKSRFRVYELSFFASTVAMIAIVIAAIVLAFLGAPWEIVGILLACPLLGKFMKSHLFR